MYSQWVRKLPVIAHPERRDEERIEKVRQCVGLRHIGMILAFLYQLRKLQRFLVFLMKVTGVAVS